MLPLDDMTGKKLMIWLRNLICLVNAWVRESTKIGEYADRRETERFSKEAFYKSDRMRTRMGVRNESASYIPEAEAMEVPSFLRRKVEFGKKSHTNRRNS